ncbi:MAG: hypothetical protein ACYCX4_03860 [Bacillota bacterium]
MAEYTTEQIQKALEISEKDAEMVLEFIRKYINRFMKNIDDLVTQIETKLDLVDKGRLPKITEGDLDQWGMKLSAMLYRAATVLEERGVEATVAKWIHQDKVEDHWLVLAEAADGKRGKGTGEERKAAAAQISRVERCMAFIRSAVESQIKKKIDHAIGLREQIRSSLSYRKEEIKLGR